MHQGNGVHEGRRRLILPGGAALGDGVAVFFNAWAARWPRCREIVGGRATWDSWDGNVSESICGRVSGTKVGCH